LFIYRLDAAKVTVERTPIEIPPPITSLTSQQPDVLNNNNNNNVARSRRIEDNGSMESVDDVANYAPYLERGDVSSSKGFYNSVRDNNSACYANVSDSVNSIAQGVHQYTDAGSLSNLLYDDVHKYTDMVGLW